MAKVINLKENKVYWSPCDIICRIEDTYMELENFIQSKAFDGRSEHGTWYIAMHRQLGELLDLMVEGPSSGNPEDLYEINID